jgi:hypothetical protein
VSSQSGHAVAEERDHDIPLEQSHLPAEASRRVVHDGHRLNRAQSNILQADHG